MQKRPFVGADINRFILAGEPQLAPDGQEVLFVRQEACTDDNKLYSTIWLVDADGNNPRPLTHGKQNDRLPRWSPDGKHIAFISGRTEQSKLWLMERAGGEAWEVKTDLAVNSAPAWAPNSKQIAFTARTFPHREEWVPYAGAPQADYERAAGYARHALAAKKDKDDKACDVKVITRLRHKMDGIGYYGDLRNQIFVVDVPEQAGGKSVCRQLTDGDFDHQNPSWSADGKELYFAADRTDRADWQLKQDLWKVNLNQGNLEQMLSWTGYIAAIECSPDGKWIAFAGDDKSHGGSTSPNLWLVPNELDMQADAAKSLTAYLDRPIGHTPSSDVRYASGNRPMLWQDNEHIVFRYGDAGSASMGRVHVGSGQIETIWQDRLRTVAAFDLAAGDRLAMQIGGLLRADDLYLVEGAKELQLTDFNASIYAECLVAPCERITYQGDAGWDIDGWLVTPPGWEQKTPLPTVLLIHGGPHGSYGSCFMFQAQVQATNGIAVFYANPRGSQSYGQKFAAAVVGDWGGGDYRDLLLGVDHLIAQGIADADKQGIMGWSYGGYMSSWAISQTDRFQAALPGAIISNRHSFYGSSDIGYSFGEHQTQGNPWEDPDKLLERSAIHFAQNINTPVLFMQGENDMRCPAEQTDQLFTALRRQGKTATMVRYPGEFHGISQPRHKRDRYQRILAWFAHYLL